MRSFCPPRLASEGERGERERGERERERERER